MDDEVQALHDLARKGFIPAEAAERQINTYLLAASHTKLLTRLIPSRRRWLLLPITDAPHYGLIPDLGQIIHRVMARDPIPSAVSAVIEQCIPSMRHVCRPVQYTDSQEILLNLIMALLLGLFPGTPKRPEFCKRALIWAGLHAILTANREEQTAFLVAHQDMVFLACMEYIARIVPVYMPVQDAFLTGQDAASAGFFKRIPPVCDEFRQFLDERPVAKGVPWREILQACTANVERVSRLKRNQPCQQHPQREGGKTDHGRVKPPLESITAHWEAPKLLDNPTPDEYRLLALSLNLHGGVVMQIQRDLQVYALPRNLARLQYERLLDFSQGETRIAHLRTYRYVCMNCTLHHKHHQNPRLRLDTIQQRLVCATCMKSDLIHVNMLGKILRFKRQHFYLCPSCVTIQQYMGQGEQPWCADKSVHRCPHKHAHHGPQPGGRKRRSCEVCNETALANGVERVNHLTGEMQAFHYCQRHFPRWDVLIKCINARQMGAYSPVCQRGLESSVD